MLGFEIEQRKSGFYSERTDRVTEPSSTVLVYRYVPIMFLLMLPPTLWKYPPFEDNFPENSHWNSTLKTPLHVKLSSGKFPALKIAGNMLNVT